MGEIVVPLGLMFLAYRYGRYRLEVAIKEEIKGRLTGELEALRGGRETSMPREFWRNRISVWELAWGIVNEKAD